MADRPFDSASAFLPEDIKKEAQTLGDDVKREATQIRLRCGQAALVCTAAGRIRLRGPYGTLNGRHIAECFEKLCRGSPYAMAEQIRRGYVTASGGHRAGICGAGVSDGAGPRTLTDISSINIRIARQIRSDEARAAVSAMTGGGEIRNAVILSPPGRGKTTLLREMVRLISNGVLSPEYDVAIADERSEIAAMHNGEYGFDVGRNTDVIDRVPKSEAISMLVRSMAPRLIAADEIGGAADAAAVAEAVRCGVSVLTTAHCGSAEDFYRRRDILPASAAGLFGVVIVLCAHGEVGRIEELRVI